MGEFLSYHVRNWDRFYRNSSIRCTCARCSELEKQPSKVVVELSIPHCCEKCNADLADAVTILEGFERLEFQDKKLIVTGDVSSEEVLKVCRKVKKSVRLWPQPSKLSEASTETENVSPSQHHHHHS